jgi:hypothetical protein
MDPIMLEWAYVREVMRCLGFLPDELFFGIHNPEGVILNGALIKANEAVVSLILRAQNKSFTWTIGTTKLSPVDARAAYEELCSSWNDGEGWSLEGFRASEAYQQKIALISALQDRGFRLNPRAS